MLPNYVHAILMTVLSYGAGDEPGPKSLPAPGLIIESVVVTLIEQVEVPAQEAGLLAELFVREGTLVKQGERLAQIDDSEQQLTQKRAQIEWESARKQSQNQISVRYAQKANEVADAELKRATDSLARYPKSISETEVDRLRLAAQKTALAVEQATFDLQLAQDACRLREAELELATLHVQRRRILAPISGMVVELKRHAGEWLEQSDTVVRVLRLDCLRAEGFLHADATSRNLVGSPVRYRTSLPGQPEAVFPGRLVFVSPEISPVNGQVRVWAEIKNPELALRPGMRGSLIIDSDTSTASQPSQEDR